MAHHTTRSRMITFLFSAALAALAVAPPLVTEAHRLDDLHARQHNRMVRVHKRAPIIEERAGCLLGLCPPSVTPSSSPSPTSGSSSASQETPSVSVSAPTSTPMLSSMSSTPTPSPINSIQSLSGGLSSNSSSSTSMSTPAILSLNSTTSLSSKSTTSAPSSYSTTPTVTTPTSSTPTIQNTRTVFVSGVDASPTNTPSPTASPISATTHSMTVAKKTVVILVAIAGSIALAFLIWTGIRKWKFRPSKNFEDRMAPIDWQPTTDHDDPAEKVAVHRRQGSTGSHGSFGTNEHNHGQDSGIALARSASGRTILQDELPPHDFTPGPAHSVSGGAPGPSYANMQRGDPPAMAQVGGAGLMRGPSLNGGDPYGGYAPYDDGLAPHMGYPAQYASHPGYGNQYRGY